MNGNSKKNLQINLFESTKCVRSFFLVHLRNRLNDLFIANLFISCINNKITDELSPTSLLIQSGNMSIIPFYAFKVQ